MTPHKIIITVPAESDKYEWAQRITDAVPADNRVYAKTIGSYVVIETYAIQMTVAALMDDGFDI